MLTGYKTYIGIGVWAVGAVCGEFFGLPDLGVKLMELGKIIVAGGFAAKAARFMSANKVK